VIYDAVNPDRGLTRPAAEPRVHRSSAAAHAARVRGELLPGARRRGPRLDPDATSCSTRSGCWSSPSRCRQGPLFLLEDPTGPVPRPYFDSPPGILRSRGTGSRSPNAARRSSTALGLDHPTAGCAMGTARSTAPSGVPEWTTRCGGRSRGRARGVDARCLVWPRARPRRLPQCVDQRRVRGTARPARGPTRSMRSRCSAHAVGQGARDPGAEDPEGNVAPISRPAAILWPTRLHWISSWSWSGSLQQPRRGLRPRRLRRRPSRRSHQPRHSSSAAVIAPRGQRVSGMFGPCGCAPAPGVGVGGNPIAMGL